jgi:hypothetical protein
MAIDTGPETFLRQQTAIGASRQQVIAAVHYCPYAALRGTEGRIMTARHLSDFQRGLPHA